MRVSIALATYNGERFLPAQLASLAGQIWQPCEVIASDDNSTDASVEMLEEFATTAPFPVKLCRNADRMGFAENFLRAASGCTGDAIAFCDQDDVWREDKLARCVAQLEADDVMLVSHQYLNTDENLRPIGSMVPKKSTSAVFPSLQVCQELVWVAGCTMVVKRKVIEEVMRCWPEDHLRIAQRTGRSLLAHDLASFYVATGMGKISYVSEPLVWHRVHGNNTCTVSPTFGHSLKRALQTGAMEYLRRSSLVQAQTEMYERMAARAAGDVAKSLFELVRKLRGVAEMNQARSRLYGLHCTSHRIAEILKMIRTGVYSNRDGRIGTRALLADLTYTVLPRMFRAF